MVILLVTGPLGSGTDEFVKVLETKYNYKSLKVTKCCIENFWDYDRQEPSIDSTN